MTVAELRIASGLTAEELGLLFGVPARTIHHWTAAPLPTPRQEQLDSVASVIVPLGETPKTRRAALFAYDRGASLFDRLRWEANQRGEVLYPPLSLRALLGSD